MTNHVQHDPGRRMSASEYHRVANCPGFLALRRSLPPRKEDDSEDATSGKKVHVAYALWDDEPDYQTALAAIGLSVQEEGCLDRALSQTRELVTKHGFETATEARERRLFMLHPPCTGQFDRCYVMARRAMVVDVKSGRDPVDPVECNYQMRLYALLAAQEFFSQFSELDEVLVAVVQPWVSSQPIVARYTPEHLDQALAELLDNMVAAAKPDAKCVPGSWCKYCECPPDCEVANVEAKKPTEALAVSAAGPVTKEEAAAWVIGISDHDLGRLLDAAAYSDMIFEAARDEAKARVGRDVAIPGWRLGKGKVMETVVDHELVFGRAEKFGATQAEFLKCLRVNKEALTLLMRQKTGLKGKKLEGLMEDLLSGACNIKTTEAPLQRSDPV